MGRTLLTNERLLQAPLVSGYMAVTGTSWRWIFWVLVSSAVILLFHLPTTLANVIYQSQAIFSGVCWILTVAYVPETYARTY
jgi:hypothetical protein